MRSDEKKVQRILDRALARHGNLPANDVDAAVQRAWESLQSERETTSEWKVDSLRRQSRAFRWSLRLAAIAAIVVLVAAILIRRDGAVATAANNQKIKVNEIVRSAAGMTLTLADQSHVEMKADSELWFERADDGIRIRLNKGGVIVNAAKQANGYLYVQTRDLLVSVVGTVFLVGTDQAGSRVGVIQGEVRVQQGATQRTLRPGNQLVSGLGMPSVPLQKEISWSHLAAAHLVMLRQEADSSNPGRKKALPLKFDAASIKPHSGAPNGESLGFVCHGADRTIRAAWALRDVRTGPVTAPQGRCVGRGIKLSDLIGFAYDTFARHVVNLPEWAVPADLLAPMNAFQIEAVAADTSTVTAEQLREMVRTMLAERFRLQIHNERQETPGYLLIAGRNGARMKLKAPEDPEEPPLPDAKLLVEERRAVLKGKSSIEDLSQWLGTVLSVVVLNKTDLTGVYDYAFPLIHGRTDEAERSRNGPPTPPERAAEISGLMEEAIGLKLQAEKAIPVQMIVVDHVDRPSQN